MAPKSLHGIASWTLLLTLVHVTSHAAGDRSEKEDQRAYPMMAKYMELLHSNVGDFKDQLISLDGLGSKAESESQKFGEHVEFLDHGLENFRNQVKKFRKVVADSAEKDIGKTRKILQEGKFNGEGLKNNPELMGMYSVPDELKAPAATAGGSLVEVHS